jgi:hypothetical protein
VPATSAVVERHVVPDASEEGYSLEFFDMTGNTVAMVTVSASAVRLPAPLIVRPFAHSALNCHTSCPSRTQILDAVPVVM